MNFRNTPIPAKPTLRYALARWGIDIHNREHMEVNPLGDFINNKGLKVFFGYHGWALVEEVNSIGDSNEDVDQCYFRLDSLPFGELREINQCLELHNPAVDSAALHVQSYSFDSYMIYPITPVKKGRSIDAFQEIDRSSKAEFYSLEELMIKPSPYYPEFHDGRLELDINNLKAFEQRYMYVDHQLTKKEIEEFLSNSLTDKVKPISSYNKKREEKKDSRKEYLHKISKSILPQNQKKVALLKIRERIQVDKESSFDFDERQNLQIADSTLSSYFEELLGKKWWRENVI